MELQESYRYDKVAVCSDLVWLISKLQCGNNSRISFCWGDFEWPYCCIFRKKPQPVLSIVPSRKTVRTHQTEGNTEKIMSKKNIYQSRKKNVSCTLIYIHLVMCTQQKILLSLHNQEVSLYACIRYQLTWFLFGEECCWRVLETNFTARAENSVPQRQKLFSCKEGWTPILEYVMLHTP